MQWSLGGSGGKGAAAAVVAAGPGAETLGPRRLCARPQVTTSTRTTAHQLSARGCTTSTPNRANEELRRSTSSMVSSCALLEHAAAQPGRQTLERRGLRRALPLTSAEARAQAERRVGLQAGWCGMVCGGSASRFWDGGSSTGGSVAQRQRLGTPQRSWRWKVPTRWHQSVTDAMAKLSEGSANKLGEAQAPACGATKAAA